MTDENKSDPIYDLTPEQQAVADQSVKDRLFVATVLEVAKAHYGDQFEDDGQYLFGLACDMVRAAAQEYEGDNGPLCYMDGTPTADVISSVLANVCPGYVCTDDENWRSEEAQIVSTPRRLQAPPVDAYKAGTQI